jgi:hypothetical protein
VYNISQTPLLPAARNYYVVGYLLLLTVGFWVAASAV